MKEKRTFKLILVVLAITLAILPFATTFNSFLTSLVEKTKAYQIIQKIILPWEVRMVGVVLQSLKIGVEAGGDTLYLTKGTKKVSVYIAWNCIGWQSLLLYLVSLIVGLQGNFTLGSKWLSALIGLIGTFLLNIFRMVITAAGIFYINEIFAMVLHDYFAALITVVWLALFWWFAYAFVLETKN